MSWQLDYLPLFRVSVEETGTSPRPVALAFRPTRDCRAELAARRMVLRPSDAGFRVLYASNPLAPDPVIAPIQERVRFTFALHATRPDFFERYQPTLPPDRGRQIYLDNLTPTGSVQSRSPLSTGDSVDAQDAVSVYPPTFQAAVDMSASPRPTRVRVLGRFDATQILTAPIDAPPAGPRGVASVDLRQRPRGVYSLDTEPASGAARAIYTDDELPGMRPLGVLDIHWEERQDAVPDGGIDYVIRFRKR